ncbi:MAG: ribonuclease HII [Pseudomonadota bacterium]|jgi:ribonuclease HII|nr:MAG: ribonuclease HII [Pseudomonadota bacterium]
MSLPDFSIEDSLARHSHGHDAGICGIDEVGRGPLAGPVVAAAVILPRPLPPELSGHIRDSKKLSAAKRARIAAAIREFSVFSIGAACVEEIDRVNILNATMNAMTRAFEGLQEKSPCSHALIDGNRAPKLPCKTLTVIKGDQTSLSIAAASIIAKEYRDTLMRRLAEDHPVYGWDSNAGYGTKIHMEALKQHGVTVHHRRSFAPISESLLQQKNITS